MRCISTRIHKQKGIALLAFVLLLVVGLSAVLVNKLETNTTFYERQLQNTEVLKEAKQALIAYAINYPEQVNSDFIGGYLPCPDTNNDGSSQGSCSESGNTNIGLYPHERLETTELLDASGEKLWFAISENFRTFPRTTPVNSDTPASLAVDSNTDIVAVIIAPGEPVAGQTRDTVISSTNRANTVISEYLEDDNNDLDTDFVSVSSGDFNDRLITITRKEIMQSLEKRVLTELQQALTNYYNDPDNNGVLDGNEFYPWLSPFSNPETSAFKSVNNTYEGHIPFHHSLDTDPNRNPFSTDLIIQWDSIVGATTTFSGTVEEDCLLNVACVDTDATNGIVPSISDISTTASCTWTNKETVDCEIVFNRVINNYELDSLNCAPATGTLTRTYSINFPAFSSSNLTVSIPTASSIRTRSINFSDSFTGVDAADQISIQDSFNGPVYDSGSGTCSVISDHNAGSALLDFADGNTANILVSNIRYDLDVDDGELDAWFVDNEWYKYIYIAYANSSIDGTACNPLSDCLNLQNSTGVYSDTNKVVAIATGETLAAQSRPSANLSDYLENENATFPADNLLEDIKNSNMFNDQIRVVDQN